MDVMEPEPVYSSTSDPIFNVLTNDTFTNSTNDTDSGTSCMYFPPPLTEVRFWIVTVFGTCVSIISMAENSFLFFLLLSRKYHRTSYNVYLMLLAFFDVFVSFAYIFLMSVNVLSDYLHSPLLVKLWMYYMTPVLTISHIAITSSSFLILAATVERYCITTNSPWLPLVQRNRKTISCSCIFIGLISKGTMVFEFHIATVPECEGLMTELILEFQPFVFGTAYHTIWRFWYRNFVTIFFPFFMLSYFNTRIVKALSHQQKQSCADLLNNSLEISKRKKTTRSATRTMILVACCYLISNILNVFLTIWEHVDKDSLAQRYDSFYIIALDFVSLATNLSCAFRVPIYLACQSQLRNEYFHTLKYWIRFKPVPHRTLDTSPQTPASPENVCLINGSSNNNANQNSITSDPPQIRNGSRTRSLSLNDNDTVSFRATNKKNDRALVSSFHEDQLSTSSSITAQNEIFKRLFWGSHKETLL